MGAIVLPGEGNPREDVEDIVFKFFFGDDEGIESSDVPVEDLEFSSSGGKDILVTAPSGKDSLRKQMLYYNIVPQAGLFWDESGNAHHEGSPFNRGFYTIGKFGPGSFMTLYDKSPYTASEAYAGKDFARAGAGTETWGRQLQPLARAYSPRQLTMMKALLNSPVVKNIMSGLDPKTGKENSPDAKVVKSVLNKFRRKYGVKDAGKSLYAFDTWPKLMMLLKEVNEAFEARDKPNPLDELALGSDFLGDPDAFQAFSGLNRVAFERQGGETDEEFYARQLDEINKMSQGLWGDNVRTLDQYYNWVIDSMVRNMLRACKALKGREKELQAARKQKARLIKTTNREKKEEASKIVEPHRAYLRGLASYKEYLEKAKGEVDAAKSRAESIRDSYASSIKEREAAFMRRKEMLDAFIKSEEERKAVSMEGLTKEEERARSKRLSNARKVASDWRLALDESLGVMRRDPKKSVMQVIEYLGDYSNELDGKLKAVENDLTESESAKVVEHYNELAGVSLSAVPSGAGSFKMFQMAVPRNNIKTLKDVLSGRQSASPYMSSNMRIVSAGIVLGETGKSLEEVESGSEEYFKLRKGMNAVEAFVKVFGVDPTRISSDERLKDFHRGWENIEDARNRSRRIVESVGRRFY